MAAPSYVSKGTFADATTGTVVPAIPGSLQNGDLLVAQIYAKTDTPTCSATGWTPMASGPSFRQGTPISFVFLMYKWSDGTDTGTVTFTIGGTSGVIGAKIFAFRNVGGNPGFPWMEADGTQTNTSTTVAHAAITTLGPDRLAVCFIGISDDTGSGMTLSGESGGTWTEQDESSTAVGSDCRILAYTSTLSSVATLSGGTATISSLRWITRTFAFVSADGQGLLDTHLPRWLQWDGPTEAGSGTVVGWYPYGVKAGDLVLALIEVKTGSVDGTASLSGWAELAHSDTGTGGVGNHDLIVMYKWAAGGESGSFTFTIGGTSVGLVFCQTHAIRYAGGNGGLPRFTSGGASSASGTSVSHTAVTTTEPALALCFGGVGDDTNSDYSLSSPWVRVQNFSTSTGSDGRLLLHVYSMNNETVSGSTGTMAATNRWTTHTMGLLPSATVFRADAVIMPRLLLDAVLTGGSTQTSFTADAVILRTQTPTVTADAVLFKTQSASLTGDAVLMPFFRADAVLLKTQSASVTADAVLKATISASFTADAVIRREQTASFTADAIIRVGQPASTTADAVLKAAISTSLTADAFIFSSTPGAAEFFADAVLRVERAASFTSDAVVLRVQSASLSANAVILRGQTASFTGNAVVLRTQTASFTADAVLLRTQSATITGDAVLMPSFTGNAVLLRTQSASFTGDAWVSGTGVTGFTADAVVKRNQTTSFLADAVKRKTQTASFTADAYKRQIFERTLQTDAYIKPPYRQQHARTGPHIGTDTDLDHLIAWSFDRYWRGENLHEILVDIDARLTAREGGRLSQRHLLPGNAIIKGTESTSALLDAYITLSMLASFVSDAYIAHYFNADALLRVIQSASFLGDAEIEAAPPLGFYADAFKSDPAVFISNSIAGAPDWNISSVRKGAVISTASLTHEAGDPSNWFVAQDKTGWAKFVVGSTTTVRLDTVGSQGNMQIVLFGPGSSPTNGNALEFNDDSVVDATNPWGFSDRIDRSVTAGTYFVGVALYDFSDADATVQLNMETL